MPHEERGGDEHAAEEEALAEELAEGGEEAGADGGAVVLDLYVDLVHLVDDVGVLGRETTDVAEVLDRLVATVPGDEPTRRLADEEGDAGEEDAARDELDREGNEPLNVRRLDVLRDTIVDPKSGKKGGNGSVWRPERCRAAVRMHRTVGGWEEVEEKERKRKKRKRDEPDETSNLPADLVHADELTTDRRRSDLRDVEGSEVRGGTNTETGDDATAVNRSETASAVSGEHLQVGRRVSRGLGKRGKERGTHDTGTKAENEGRGEETKTTTEELPERVAEDGTEEAASLVGRDDVCGATVSASSSRKGGKTRKNALDDMAANSLAVLVDRPNSLLKAGREMEVPMKAESYLSNVERVSFEPVKKKKKRGRGRRTRS